MEDDPEVFSFQIPDAVPPDRADKILARCFTDKSRSQIQKALDAGLISLGDTVIKRREKLTGGDLLQISWVPEPPTTVEPVNIPLRILFEDTAIVVVDKIPGMITHPGSGTGRDTLVHALLFHTGGRLSAIGAPERPGIVHRLDKETSGILVVAKTDAAHHHLVNQFSSRTMRKEYLAWVDGSPGTESGTLQTGIDRHPVVRTRMMVRDTGKPAHTDWIVTERANRAALLRCRIHTGRTHQIRVHLQHLGHPILGDVTYGYKRRGHPAEPVPRVMLHAALLELEHPCRGERMVFEAPEPEDFHQIRERVG